MADLPTYKEVSYNISLKGHTEYHRANLGDGYSQIAAKGINANKRFWQLELRNLTNTIKHQFIDFFEGLQGDTFNWIPKGDTANQKWLYLNYECFPKADSKWIMIVNIEKDFRLY